MGLADCFSVLVGDFSFISGCEASSVEKFALSSFHSVASSGSSGRSGIIAHCAAVLTQWRGAFLLIPKGAE